MRETRCPYCGKMFFPAPQHIFIDAKGAYCKPTCWLHRDEGRVDRRKASGRAQKIGKYSADGVLIKVFPSCVAASKDLGRSVTTVRNAIRRGELYGGYKWQYIEGDTNDLRGDDLSQNAECLQKK